MREIVAGCITGLLLLTILVASLNFYMDCKYEGGTVVRGLFSLECINGN